MNRLSTSRSVSFGMILGMLVVLVGGMGVLLYLTLNPPAGLDAHTRRYMARLAWLSLVLLSLAVLMLFWVVVRFVKFLIGQQERPAPTSYVDAWAEAGQRFRLKEDEDLSEPEDPDQEPPEEQHGD